MPTMLSQLLRALLREAVLHKTLMVAGFAVVSLAVLTAGFLWPKKYESQATLFADEQNIIRPLLEGKAPVTGVDRAQQAKELVQTRRVIEMIARQAKLVNGSEPPNVYEATLATLRGRLNVFGLQSGGNNSPGNYIRMTYSASSADEAFRVIGAAVDVFMKDTGESKRRESREAYEFIDSQVKTYKQQLMQAEERLKQFNANNQDGSEQAVSQRISQLQNEIETLKLDISDARTRKAALEQQLAGESQYLNRRYRADVYREQINDAQARLDNLLLTYTPTHPDVVSLRHQIEDLRRSMESSRSAPAPAAGGGAAEASVNPLYEQLRGELSQVSVNIQSLERRLTSTQKLLEAEFSRSKRVAERQADLAELTRDYTVTRNIYEDLLERKERARIAMTLDVEGQGVTYRIQEAPTYPSVPTGLRFLHFVLLGPILGVLLPLAALVAYIQLDPRIRFPRVLESALELPVVAVVPHVTTPFAKRMLRSDMLVLSAFVALVLLIYTALVLLRALEVL